ncbi:MAG: acetylornithine deacetylase [bacterium]
MREYLYHVAARLLAFDNTSGNPSGEAMRFLAGELEGSGFRTVLQPVSIRGVEQHNLVAWAGPAAPDGLILSGHVDTVPFADQPGWTRPPLALTVESDRVWGRGTADMKGFLAQCLTAARALPVSRLERPVVLAFTAEEEVGCSGAERLAPALQSLLGGVPMPRMAWIGEPTSWAVYHAHKGIVQLRVTVRGRGGHSSLPQDGVNAISVAARAIEAIGAYQAELAAPRESMRQLFPDAPCTTLNVGRIRGGTASNMIADECAFTVSYRPLPDRDPLEPWREIERRMAGLARTDYGGGSRSASIDVSEPQVVPPLRSPVDTPLAAALQAVLGAPPRGGAPYATDGGRFAQAGIDVLICGPGALADAHQPDEGLSRADFERGPEVILQVLNQLCLG